MLKQISDGAWLHASDFLASNAVIIEGKAGVLLIDPGITLHEMKILADDLERLGQQVVAGFSTHPHWDHLLWHVRFSDVPRYGTGRNVAEIQAFMRNAKWKELAARMLPPELANEIPLDETFGKITALPLGAVEIPWQGPTAQIFEHQGHAAGSVALLIEECKVLVAGDMISDILVPFLDLDATDPIEDYLAALQLLESLAEKVRVFVPGHGSCGDAGELRSRIEQDRRYVLALRDGVDPIDQRLITGPQKDLLASVHQRQVEYFAR